MGSPVVPDCVIVLHTVLLKNKRSVGQSHILYPDNTFEPTDESKIPTLVIWAYNKIMLPILTIFCYLYTVYISVISIKDMLRHFTVMDQKKKKKSFKKKNQKGKMHEITVFILNRENTLTVPAGQPPIILT